MICRADRFTETPMSPDDPADECRQAAPCAHASRSTHSPSGTIRPDSSAAPRNSRGGTTWSPRHQRTSASAPVTREVASSTIGWYCSVSSPLPMARCRSLTISSRRTTSACMCAA